MLISGSSYLPKNSLLQYGMHELNMLCLEGEKKPYYIRLMEKGDLFIDFLCDFVQDSPGNLSVPPRILEHPPPQLLLSSPFIQLL